MAQAVRKKPIDLDWDSAFVKDLLQKQTDDLIKCWNVADSLQPIIAILDIETAIEIANRKGYILQIDSNKKGVVQGFFWEKPSAEPECWLDKKLSGKQYRAAFHRFLQRYYGLQKDQRLHEDIVVEHVLNAERAKNNFDFNFLRVTIADTHNNSVFGSQWEFNNEDNQRKTLDHDYTNNNTVRFAEQPVSTTTVGEKINVSTLEIFWPMATKAFDIDAPRGSITDEYILSTIIQLIQIKLIPESDLDQPYGFTKQVFMMGEKNIPHFDGQSRVKAYFKDPASARELTENDSLKDWLCLYPLPVQKDVLRCLQNIRPRKERNS